MPLVSTLTPKPRSSVSQMMRRAAPGDAASMTRFVSLTDEYDILLPPVRLAFGDHMVTTRLDTVEIRRNEQTTAFFINQYVKNAGKQEDNGWGTRGRRFESRHSDQIAKLFGFVCE